MKKLKFFIQKLKKTAREEGFDKIADTFHYISKAEKHHRDRYAKLLENVKNGTVFKKDKEINWMCRECGFICHSKCAPMKCPSCEHPQAYFQVQCEEY